VPIRYHREKNYVNEFKKWNAVLVDVSIFEMPNAILC
jgi:hypothetical protein